MTEHPSEEPTVLNELQISDFPMWIDGAAVQANGDHGVAVKTIANTDLDTCPEGSGEARKRTWYLPQTSTHRSNTHRMT